MNEPEAGRGRAAAPQRRGALVVRPMVSVNISGRHLASLDGIRAIAVGLVVLFHANIGIFVGGAIGVDVFFVLSGFLITSLLLSEHASTGSISIVRFYARRALRLYPALIAMLLAVLVAAAVLQQRDGQMHLDGGAIRSALTALLYLTDLAVGWDLRPEIQQDLAIFHTWSLSVEEHFYLLWPLVVVAVLRCSRGRRLLGLAIATLALLALGIVLSGVVVASGASGARLDYSPEIRGTVLLVGCALALLIHRRSVVLPRLLPWVALALLVVLACVQVPCDARPFVAVIVVGGASAMVILGALDEGGALARLFAWRPMVLIGARSYGIYLWHFPTFYVVSADTFPGLVPWQLAALKLLVTAVLVEVCFRLVERPFLRLRLRFRPRPRRLDHRA